MPDDKLILEMHGKLNTLLERSENTKDFLASVNRKTEEHEKAISDIRGDITGIKWIGAIMSAVFSGVGFFWKK